MNKEIVKTQEKIEVLTGVLVRKEDLQPHREKLMFPEGIDAQWVSYDDHKKAVKETRQDELKKVVAFMHSQFPKFQEKMFLEKYERFKE